MPSRPRTPWRDRLRRRTEWLWLATLAAVLSLHFWFFPLKSGVAHDTFSVTAEGQKAFYLLAQQRFFWATRNFEPLVNMVSDSTYEDTLFILGPARPPNDDEWTALLDWVSGGGSLLYAARGEEAFEIPQTDIQVESNDQDSVWSDEPEPPRTELATGDFGWRSVAKINAPTATPLVKHKDTVQAVLLRHGSGRIVVVASDFIFTNQSLAWKDNSVLAMRLVEAAGPESYVTFDESLNETGTPKIVGLLFSPSLRSITVQLLAVTLLYGWWRSRRFGPLLPTAAPARHNIVDHTDTVGRLYWNTKDGAGVLRIYFKQLVSDLRLKHHKGHEDRVLEPIARRLGRKPRQVHKLLRNAAKSARGRRPLDRRAAAGLIRQLSHVRLAMRPKAEGKSIEEERG